MTRLVRPTILALSTAASTRAFSAMSPVIDSHLHVWATADEAASRFPYAGADQVPPPQLQNAASPSELLAKMAEAGVDGALIVQPINHKFDHSSTRTDLKGCCCMTPASPRTVERLEELVLAGFVGVRFNPYLWPEGELMSDECGLAVYKRCAELKVPVGVMCFKGLNLHIDDIETLIAKSPDTPLILDHLGFCSLNEAAGDKAFEQLLSLARHPNVYVKVSALFRNVGEVDSFPYEKVKEKRFGPLLKAYGASRLMVGSDFPFVLETEGGYKGAIHTVQSWIPAGSDRDALMGGTAEKLFGKWVA
ncbi:hypothetical protein ACHAXT_006883 [Thalassiosira profunda]